MATQRSRLNAVRLDHRSARLLLLSSPISSTRANVENARLLDVVKSRD